MKSISRKISNKEYENFMKSCMKDKTSTSEKLREIIKNQTQIKHSKKNSKKLAYRNIPKDSEYYQTSNDGKTFEPWFLL